MANLFRLRPLLLLAAVVMAGLLGGCVVYPAYPVYNYGYGTPYYGGGYVTFGDGWHRGHDDGWRR
jgi:hypothetical protein